MSASTVPTHVCLSGHARQRSYARRIPVEHVRLALDHGTRIHQDDGVTHYHLGRQMIPPDLSRSLASRVEGTTVVQAYDRTVITVYRSTGIPRLMRRARRPRRRR